MADVYKKWEYVLFGDATAEASHPAVTSSRVIVYMSNLQYFIGLSEFTETHIL